MHEQGSWNNQPAAHAAKVSSSSCRWDETDSHVQECIYYDISDVDAITWITGSLHEVNIVATCAGPWIQQG